MRRITNSVSVVLILFILLVFTSCGTAGNTSESSSPTPTATLSDAEKQAAEYERIAQEALDNEHAHVWVFSHYQEQHPHSAEYKCECGAVKIVAHETADFEMTIVGKSPEHPHYMLEECSICHQQFPNENLPTELKWEISGYQPEHPHLAILKCTQCEYTETNPAITALSTGVCKLISEESTAEHPHYLIVKCTYPGCDHSYIEKNATAEWEYMTDPENYSIAHPHNLFGVCDYDGCMHETLLDETADWEWEDGVCSICGAAKDVKYTKDSVAARVTGLVDEDHAGELHIPNAIEGFPVESIEPDAFADKILLTSVNIPDSAIFIGNSAFSGCLNLELEESTDCPVTANIGEIYDSPASQPLAFFIEDLENGHTLGYIGKNVQFIETGAFRNCISLVSVCMGESIVEIQPYAFEGCLELRHLFITAPNAPAISPDSFAGTSPDLRIYVPAGSVGYDIPEWEQYEIIYYELP